MPERGEPLNRRTTGVRILSSGCVCGHDHETSRGEHVEMCLECSCIDHIPRCQNCGQESTVVQAPRVKSAGLAACSVACVMQLEHAMGLLEATRA